MVKRQISDRKIPFPIMPFVKYQMGPRMNASQSQPVLSSLDIMPPFFLLLCHPRRSSGEDLCPRVDRPRGCATEGRGTFILFPLYSPRQRINEFRDGLLKLLGGRFVVPFLDVTKAFFEGCLGKQGKREGIYGYTDQERKYNPSTQTSTHDSLKTPTDSISCIYC